MNAAQKAKALEVINNDCEITKILMNEEGQTCAVGGLALAAGIHRSRLVNRTWSQSVIDEVEKAYGVDYWKLKQIMGLNDRSRWRWLRRRRIRNFVNKLEVTA